MGKHTVVFVVSVAPRVADLYVSVALMNISYRRESVANEDIYIRKRMRR